MFLFDKFHVSCGYLFLLFNAETVDLFLGLLLFLNDLDYFISFFCFFPLELLNLLLLNDVLFLLYLAFNFAFLFFDEHNLSLFFYFSLLLQKLDIFVFLTCQFLLLLKLQIGLVDFQMIHNLDILHP